MSNEAVLNALSTKLTEMSGEKLESTITKMLITAQGYAAQLTPVATSNLINSQYRKVDRKQNKITGELGYGANYALYVHNAPGKLKDKGVFRYPRRLGTVWSPDAEPKFLKKGVEEMLQQDAFRIIDEVMGL